MNTLLKVVDHAVTTVIAALLLTVVLVSLGNSTGAFTAAPVYSESMAPTIKKGDVVVVRATPTETLKVGDIVVFQPCKAGAPRTVHRVDSIDPTTKAVGTRGDNNPAPDPWKCQFTAPYTQTVTQTVPFVGHVWLWLQDPTALKLSIIVTGLLLLFSILYHIWTHEAVISTAPAR